MKKTILIVLFFIGVHVKSAVCYLHNYSGSSLLLTSPGLSWKLPDGDSSFGVSASVMAMLSANSITLDTNSDWDVIVDAADDLAASRRFELPAGYHPQTGVEPFQLFVLGILFITCVSYLLRSFF